MVLSALPKWAATHIAVLGLVVSCGSPETNAQNPRSVGTSESGDKGLVTGTSAGSGYGSPSLSADGRFLAYTAGGVMVLDRTTNQTEQVSVSTKGTRLEGHAPIDISADGRFVAFFSPPDHIYIHDREKGTTTLVSVSSSGKPANSGPFTPFLAMSDDGRFVAFNSGADNLVPDDTNKTEDIFVRDIVAERTMRASISSTGAQAEGAGAQLSISNDGRFIIFISGAGNLVGGTMPHCKVLDYSGPCSGVFVHDRVTGETSIVSVSSSGERANGRLQDPSISDDGRYVTYSSTASNLAEGSDHSDLRYRLFLHDRSTRQTVEIASTHASSKWMSQLSGTGALVAYTDGDSLWVYDREMDSRRSLGAFYGGSVDFTSDDRLIAFTNELGRIVIWNLLNGESETIPPGS